jgi:FG-GAP-like repeat
VCIATAMLVATLALSPSASASLFATGPTNFGAGSVPTSIAARDLNGDGRPDLVVANRGSSGGADGVSVLINSTLAGATTPSFAGPTDFAAGTTPTAVALGDLNGDGMPDIVVANGAGISVLLNTTTAGAMTPSFALASPFAAGSAPSDVVLGDFNLDGKADIAATNSSGVSVLLNTTTAGSAVPSFTAASAFAAGSAPTALAAGDLNGDGKPDLAVTNSEGLSVLLNTTAAGAVTPSFTLPTTFAAGVGARGLAIADFNGDGKPDLAVVGANGVTLLLNTTTPGAITPTFTAASTVAAGNGPTSVAAADVNGDGRPDLVVTNSGGVSVLLNTTVPGAATPSFAPPASFAAGSGPTSIAVSDVNGDFAPDLAVANGGGVSVLLNTMFAPPASGAGTVAAVAATTTTTTTTAASGPSLAAAAPVITSARISPASFAAADRGASLARAAVKGATVTYRISIPATTTFTVLRRATGVKMGIRCVASGQHKPKKPCVRLVDVGSIARPDHAGAVRVHFTGRVGGRKLAPATYVLRLTPRAAGRTGSAIDLSFRITL